MHASDVSQIPKVVSGAQPAIHGANETLPRLFSREDADSVILIRTDAGDIALDYLMGSGSKGKSTHSSWVLGYRV